MSAPSGQHGLGELGQLTKVDPDASHRALLGPLVVWLKRLGRALIHPLVGPWLERQERFNRRVAEILEAGTGAPESLADCPVGEAEVERLGKRLEIVHETLSREIAMRESTLRRELDQEMGQRVMSALGSLAAEKQSAVASESRATEVLGDQLYRCFEDRYRGTSKEIRSRLEAYVEDFRERAPVLDVGCGRGEFLALLGDHGIEARGVDLSEEMVRISRDAGREVTHADALEYLCGLPGDSLGGIFSAQFVEHLEAAAVQSFLVQGLRVLRPGGVLVVETVNVESLVALTRNYFADWTHRTPIGPTTLSFLATELGYSDTSVRYLSPLPEHACLERVPVLAGLDTPTRDLVDVLNRNVDRLNALLYGPQDFALIAHKP